MEKQIPPLRYGMTNKGATFNDKQRATSLARVRRQPKSLGRFVNGWARKTPFPGTPSPHLSRKVSRLKDLDCKVPVSKDLFANYLFTKDLAKVELGSSNAEIQDQAYAAHFVLPSNSSPLEFQRLDP